MKLYDKIVNLAKGKGMANANQIMKQCNIATNTWYSFRRTDKLNEATKERLALGLGISTGDLNVMMGEALGEELKAKGEIRPGEPNKKASGPAVEKEDAPAELPEAIQVEETIPADDADAVLEAAIEEVTRYLPKEPEKDYYQKAKEKAEKAAMELLKKVALEQMCDDIGNDVKNHIDAFYSTGEISYLKMIQEDILPAWIRAEEELEEYDE